MCHILMGKHRYNLLRTITALFIRIYIYWPKRDNLTILFDFIEFTVIIKFNALKDPVFGGVYDETSLFVYQLWPLVSVVPSDC
jgi:hypothetical protein